MEATSPGIERLQKSIVSRLRSGIAIDSITQCIDELVTNSIDAGASCIAVRTNISVLRFQVVDNGCGLTKDELSIIGERYATSKCNELSDLERLDKFGFRGEAIASLKDLSSILEIESREKASLNTFCKVFSNSSATQVFQKKKDRPSQGTTVTVHSLFHNLPVRQKRINESLELESIRHRLAAIALIHPKISFSLRDDSSNSIILQTRKSGSIGRSFASLFGDKKAACLKEIKYCNEEFSIEGFIGTDGHHNKSLQFMYINSRLLLKTKLHKLVNTLLSKSLIGRKKLWQTSETTQSTYNQINGNSPGKATDQFGIFVLNISCPLADYEITLDPRKTLVEFREWEKIIGFCTQLVNDFLFRENLTMPIDNTATQIQLKKQDDQSLPSANSDLHKDTGVEQYGQAISTTSCTSTLHSLIVKRPSTSENQQCCLKGVLDSDTPVSQYKPGETVMQKVSLDLEDNMDIQNDAVTLELENNMDIQNDGKLSNILGVPEVSPSGDSTPGVSESTESAVESEEASSGSDFTDDTSKETATNMQMTQSHVLSMKVTGQEMVNELEFLEEDCHQNTTKSIEQTVDHMLSNSIVPCETNVQYDRKQRMLSSESENSLVSMSSKKMSNVSDNGCSKINITCDVHPEGFKGISNASNSNHRTPIDKDDTKLKNQSRRQCKCSHAEYHRRKFHKVSGKDLLEDLEKLDADSQESIEENILFTDSTNFLQKVQKPSTNHLKNYTNSLQVFKKSECRTGSVQSMLTRKLKQQKESYDTDKQKSKLAYIPQVSAVLSKTCKGKEDLKDNKGEIVALPSFNKNIKMQAINSITNQPNISSVILQPSSKSTPKKKCEDCIHDVIFDVTNVRLQQSSVLSDNDSFSCENGVIVSSGHSSDDAAEDIRLSSFDSSDIEVGPGFVDHSVDAQIYKIADHSEHLSGKPVLVENQPQCSRKSLNKCDNNAHRKESDDLRRNFHVDEEEASFGPNSETEVEPYLLKSTIESAPDLDLTNPSLPKDNLKSSESAYIATGEPATEKQPYDMSLTSCTESLYLSSDSSSCCQNLPDAVIKENDINGWLCHYDNRLGKNVYVNKSTGNSQFVEPIQIEEDDRSECQDGTSFSISKDQRKRTHPFLPINATPFLPRTKKQRQAFNPHVDQNFAEKISTTLSLENMVDDHLNELEVDIECKWKNPSEVIKTGSDLSSLITHWDSGAALLRDKDVVNVCMGDARKADVRIHSAMHQYNFTKEMLCNAKVLGQLDNKFIACMLHSEGKVEIEPNLLVLLDQHAAHERVRLEKLTSDAIDNDEGELSEGFSEVRIKSSKLHPPITMTFASKEIRLIVGFHDRFKRMGLQMNCCAENAVEVTSVPACFIEHDVSEMKHGRKPVTAAVVESLINEQLTLWMETSGACATLPQTIIKVLNSQACHGAIKFGDTLDMAECQNLVDELAKCDLPFQCAHGRPSIVPILDFNLMRPVPVSVVSSKPQLWRLQKSSLGRSEPD